MDIDWERLVEESSVDPGVLKRQVDLVSACEQLGIVLDDSGDGIRFVGLCPFHEDNEPSFDVYEADDGTQRAGCFACDFGPSNDLFDLLTRLRGYSFPDALREAQELARNGRPRSERPAREPRKTVDIVSFVTSSVERGASPLASLVSSRGFTTPGRWIADEFRIGSTPDGAVVVPHFNLAGEITAAKIRRQHDPDFEREWTPRALSGSKLTELYGVWRSTDARAVVLVEGESDTWAVAYATRSDDDVDVFGLPSGANQRPKREWLEFLAGRDITLLFDADPAGRAAAKTWASQLGVCKIAILDEGTDASGVSTERVRRALNTAEKIGHGVTPGLVEAPFEGYIRDGLDEPEMISDFTLSLTSVIELPDNDGFEFAVTIQPSGTPAVIASNVFENDGRMRAWCNARGRVWHGRVKDGQELLRMLRQDSVFVPRYRGLRYVGWIDNSFVLPTSTIGSRAWVYAQPPEHEADDFQSQIDFSEGEWDAEVPLALVNLHTHDVTTPVLGWIAAAPVRALVKQFPILACVGVAGSGKSTIISEMLLHFGMHTTSPRALTNMTRYGVETSIMSTNAIPIWFDEYRAGAREQAREGLDSMMRDAWESSSSSKGGMGKNLSAIRKTVMRAPIVISGEDMPSEQSHIERMLIVQLPRVAQQDHPGRVAYDLLGTMQSRGFGRSYIEWLIAMARTGDLPAPPVSRDRKEHCRAVARWGYGLLDQFCKDTINAALPAYVEDNVLATHRRGSERPPIVEAMVQLYGRWSNGVQIVWAAPDQLGICVRLYDFVRECKGLGIPLPGNAQAVKMELEQRYEVATELHDDNGAYIYVANPR